MNKLTRILKENLTWNSKYIQVYVDNLHHPFFETPKEYLLPSVSIHGLEEYTAEKYLQEIKTFLPKEVENFSVISLGFFKRETSKLILALDLNFDENKFIYLIKFECKHLGGVKNNNVVYSGTQEYGISCYTNKIYYTQAILPAKSIQKEKNQIVSFEILPFTKSIFENNLDSPKKKFISELFDEIDYSHLIEEINEKIEFKKYWELGKIFLPLKMEHLSLATQFLSFDITKNIEWFEKFQPLIISIMKFETPLQRHKLAFYEWLKSHHLERILTQSKNLAWKIQC